METKNEKELNYQVDNMEKRLNKVENKQEATEEILVEIKQGVVSINEQLKSSSEKENLKNQLLAKDIDGIKSRVDKLEGNQRWLVIAVLGEVLAIIFGIIMSFINKGLQ